MPDQVIRLIYPPNLLDVPIINQLIRRFDLTFNILRAEVTPEAGWVDLQLTGSVTAIENAITWLAGRGIEVQHLAQ
jgi:ABC-type methionine transport system ATPase subunit